MGIKVVLGASLALLFFMAYLTAIRPAFALAYGLGLLFLLAAWWPRLAAQGIRVLRVLNTGHTTVGEGFEETFSVSKASWVPAPWVEVRDQSGIKGYQPGRVISLGREPVTWATRGVYRQRGWVSFGPTRVVVAEPFGLFSRELKFMQRTRVLVYPRVRPLPDVLMPAAQHVGEAQRFGSWADYPPETGGVRDYAPGDSFGRIHWPLSVKYERLVSKTFEQPQTTDLWIVLDLQRQVHYGEGEESTLEYAVSLAASLAVQVQSRGRSVGLLANDSRGTLLQPHRAVRQDRAILDYLAVAQADGTASLATALSWDRLRRMPRRAVAVITPSGEPGWVNAFSGVRARGTSLLAFYIDAASFGGPERELGFELGSDVDLYVLRNGDDFTRLVRTRDAIRIG